MSELGGDWMPIHDHRFDIVLYAGGASFAILALLLFVPPSGSRALMAYLATMVLGPLIALGIARLRKQMLTDGRFYAFVRIEGARLRQALAASNFVLGIEGIDDSGSFVARTALGAITLRCEGGASIQTVAAQRKDALWAIQDIVRQLRAADGP